MKKDSAHTAPAMLSPVSLKRLDQIEAALDRMDAGTYGTCTGCNGRISVLRLDRDPTVSQCKFCACDA